MVSVTVSTQKVADISTALAFGAVAAGSPSRNAMSSVPPPNSGALGMVSIRMTVVAMMFWAAARFFRTMLGLSRMSCVIVPAAMKLVRSCGSRKVSVLAAVWLGNLMVAVGSPILKGVMSTGFICGPPLMVNEVP